MSPSASGVLGETGQRTPPTMINSFWSLALANGAGRRVATKEARHRSKCLLRNDSLWPTWRRACKSPVVLTTGRASMPEYSSSPRRYIAWKAMPSCGRSLSSLAMW
jgi:hypothetical protein